LKKPAPKLVRKRIKTKIKNPDRVQLRRQQIIEGAIKVFTEKGFHNSTTKEIAKTAGITEGTLYNYVRSKEDIIYIVYDYITGLLRSDLAKAISRESDPKKRLKAALLQNLKSINEYQNIILFMYKESGSLDKESLYSVLARETEYIEMFESLLMDYLGDSVKDNSKIKITADLLSYIPVIITFRRWSLKRRFDSIETVIDDIINFILHGIQFAPETEKHSEKMINPKSPTYSEKVI
jgi:AcrR family transcriptional regulator